jgi:putative membrane protein
MRARLTATAAVATALLVGWPALAQAPAQPVPGAAAAAGVPQVAAPTEPAPPAIAADFLVLVMGSDVFEIAAGRLALERGGSDRVLMVAQKLVAAHTLSSAIVGAVAERAGVSQSSTPSMNPEQETMLQQLATAAPEAFDQLYLEQQVVAHERAIALFTAYATSGDNETIRTYAEMMVPALQAHLAMIQG